MDKYTLKPRITFTGNEENLDVVYIGSMDHNLYAINAENGQEIWRFSAGEAFESSPTVSDDVVYIRCMDQNLYAIDAISGEGKWKYQVEGRKSSPPVIIDGVVYFQVLFGDIFALIPPDL